MLYAAPLQNHMPRGLALLSTLLGLEEESVGDEEWRGGERKDGTEEEICDLG